MVMLFGFCQSCQFFLNGIATLHGGKQLLSVQLSPRCGHDNSRSVMLLEECYCFFNFLFGCIVGVRQNDAPCIFDLIVEEFSEISHIHLALVDIRNGGKSVQHRTVRGGVLNCADNVRKLSNSGRLDENTVGMILVQHLFERLSEISNQGATNAPAIHFGHFYSCVLHKSAIDADFAEFVLNQHQFFACVCFLQKFFDQRSLPCSQKSRENINLRHVFNPSVFLDCIYPVYYKPKKRKCQPIKQKNRSAVDKYVKTWYNNFV